MTAGYPEPAEQGRHRYEQPPDGEAPAASGPPGHAREGSDGQDATNPKLTPAPEPGAEQAPESMPTTAVPHPAQQSQAPQSQAQQTQHMQPVSPNYADPNTAPGYPDPAALYGQPPAPGLYQQGGYPAAQQYGPPGMYGEPDPGYAVPNPPAPNPYAAQGPGSGMAPDDLGRHAQQAAHDLSSAKLLKSGKREPQSGWRRAVYVASGRTVNFGESAADVHRRELIARVNQPLRGCYKIAMLSLKGGVGKTTTTSTLGSTFSSLRGDRVIAVDANPDRGTLSQKIPLETTATVRHLLRDANRITRYSDIRAYTSQGPSRLEVLASEQDPAVSEAFSESDYRRTIDLLEHFYNIVLTDCGTGLMHSAMKGVLDIADSLVVVSSGSIDGARSASATLDWLDAHGYRDLVGRSVAVINSVRPKSGTVQLERLEQHFAARCRAVCQLPFDPHLEEGAEIELDRLSDGSRLALLELAASVADDFSHDGNRR